MRQSSCCSFFKQKTASEIRPRDWSSGVCSSDRAHARHLLDEGADLIDVGGESTRPKAAPVSEEQELRRVLPVIERLAGEVKLPISIDTLKPAVARACLRAGASLVNDVAAGRNDELMWEVVAEARA